MTSKTVWITFTHQPHQSNCNPKHMYQHLNVLTRFVCWACRMSRTVHMSYESMHTISNWDTHEANCDTEEPNQETYHPHNPRDTNNLWLWWPLSLYKRFEFVTRIIIKYIQFIYTRKYALKNVSKGKKATRKRIPPPPDDDSEGSDIEVSQSNPSKKKKQYSKPKLPTPAVSDENKSDDASSSHSTSNIIPSSSLFFFLLQFQELLLHIELGPCLLQHVQSFRFLWSTCMPFFIVIKKCGEEWLIRRLLYPNGIFSDCSGPLTVRFVRTVPEGT